MMKNTINITHQPRISRRRQTGAALVVSLLLLVIITVLAVSGMNTATTELALARNDQNYEYAFQAAETGLEIAIARRNFSTQGTIPTLTHTLGNDSVEAIIEYEASTFVPDRAFSLGSGSGVSAYHFLTTAKATSKRQAGPSTDRDSTAAHTQAFYVVGPAASSL
jgi:type IV pilus assembly protein PilX